MKRVAYGIEMLGFILLAGSLAFAQAPGGSEQQAPPMTNLQVFPKDMPRAQVIQTMNAFNTSLGVQCNYCHVLEGPGGRNDFASDEKQTKRTARQMILFRDSINVILPTVVGKAPGAPVRVLCLTCHRGLPIPKQIADAVTEAEGTGGAEAGLAKFKELRAQFYGSWTYDFSENALLSVAQREITAAKLADAMAYLQANLSTTQVGSHISGDGASEANAGQQGRRDW